MCVFVSVWVALFIPIGRVNTGLDDSQSLFKVQMLLKQKRQEVELNVGNLVNKFRFKAQNNSYTVVVAVRELRPK